MSLSNPDLRARTFATTPLLAGLSPEEKQAIAELAREKHYPNGGVLFREGEPCDGMWVIGAGSVKLAKAGKGGREITIAIDSAPSSVAEVPLFDGGPYPATVTALTDVIAYLLLKQDFYRFCERNPRVPLKVLAVVGRRLRQLVGLVESVTFGSVRQRLARTFLGFRAAARSDDFDLPMTHEQLAFHVGTVREVVTRNLKRFQDDGILTAERGRIRILRPDLLETEAETDY